MLFAVGAIFFLAYQSSVVLDEAFLSKRAPEENAVWLEHVASGN